MVGFLDRCIFLPTAGGLGNFVVSSAILGYRTPAQAGAVNNQVYRYFAESTTKADWELGEGAYSTSGPTLARTTIVASSNAGAKVNFTSAPDVYITLRSLDITVAQGGFDAPMINGSLSATVNSNSLVISVKTAAGNDPSATDPVVFRFRDPTLVNGNYVDVAVTAALSHTINAGSTLGVSSNQPFNLYPTAHLNASSAVKLGVIQCVVGGLTPTQIVGLDDGDPVSATLGGGNSAGIFYASENLTLRPFRILGRMTWSGGLASAGYWSAIHDRLTLMGPGVKRPGEVVQTVNRATLNVTTSSVVTMAGSDVYVSITPRRPTNPILLNSNARVGFNDLGNYVTVQMAAVVSGVINVIGNPKSLNPVASSARADFGFNLLITGFSGTALLQAVFQSGVAGQSVVCGPGEVTAQEIQG